MVLQEFLGLADMTKTQMFHIYKLSKVIIVNEIKNPIFATFKVIASSFKGLNNNQKLLIVGLIMSFSRNHFLKEKSHWMSLTNFRFRKN